MACPLAPPGVTPSMSEDFQALMRQGDRSDPLGERTWKTDFAPDVEDANNCLDARPDDLICIQGGVDAPFDAPLMCGLMDPADGTTCTEGCGTSCMWNNVKTFDDKLTKGTGYTYRHLRNYKDQSCMIASRDIVQVFRGKERSRINKGEGFDDHVIAKRPSWDIPGDDPDVVGSGLVENLVTMDFCIDTLEAYFETTTYIESETESYYGDDVTVENFVKVGMTDFFASAHFPCSKPNCGMMDVDASFADTFNTMFTTPLGFVPSIEFRDAREYKQGPEPDALPFGGLDASIAKNLLTMKANTDHPNRPNIFVREHGKIAPGHTPMYGTLPDVVRRLGMCG